MKSGEQVLWEAHVRELEVLAKAAVIREWAEAFRPVARAIREGVENMTRNMKPTAEKLNALARALDEGKKYE